MKFYRHGTARQKLGLAPGTPVHIGRWTKIPRQMQVFDYSPENMHEKILENVEQSFPYRDSETVSWINVNGLHDTETMTAIGDHFQLHPLCVEDILNTGHRPKVEVFDDYLLIIVKMLSLDKDNSPVSEQVSLIVGNNYVLSFQERKGDVFNPIRERIRQNTGRIRKMDASYLAYSLLDAVTDNYFVVLESVSERLEAIEKELMMRPTRDLLKRIHTLKMELFYIRRAIWPLRENVSQLLRDECPHIKPASHPFFRDLYDHTIHVIDTLETFREVASSITDLYMSSMGNRMNEVMQVLTTIATIFIPLTFIAGIYGMNFEVMPELKWKYGYAGVWGVMLTTAVGMGVFFRRRHWL